MKLISQLDKQERALELCARCKGPLHPAQMRLLSLVAAKVNCAVFDFYMY
jgi:hypothetical protein